MPIYEYQCESCQHELEVLQKISDPVLVECPHCQQPRLKKKISAAGFRLKGGGWYETDFKSGGRKNIAGDDGGKPAASSGDAKSTGDSKPAAGSAKSSSASESTG